MAFKHKRRVQNAKNRYLKPGALALLRYSKAAAKSYMDIGKKRVVLDSEKAEIGLLHQTKAVFHGSTPVASPSRMNFPPFTGKQSLPGTPKTPQAEDYDTQSRIEFLPIDLLVKILCHLHHDQLRAVFHVSRRFRKSVLLARQCHFDYTTPDRSRQEMLRIKTPLPTEHWPFVSFSKGEGRGVWRSSPHTPKAPRHGPRPHLMDMKQIAAVLFQESALPSKCIVPPGLPRPVFKCMASNRVLFYEDELCQAVAQNRLP